MHLHFSHVRDRPLGVQVEQQPPIVNVQQGEAQVNVEQAQPIVDVQQAPPTVDIQQGDAQVQVETTGTPAVSASIAEGAEISTTTEEGAPEVEVTSDGEPTIIVEQEDLEQLAAATAVAVFEIEFAFNSDVLPDAEREAILREVADIVQSTPSAAVLLTGHASAEGDAAYNMQLSKRRVDVVESALVELGVDAAMIRTRSLGGRRTSVALKSASSTPARSAADPPPSPGMRLGGPLGRPFSV